MTDYAYAPNDNEPLSVAWQGLFRYRTNTTPIPPSGTTANLRDFIKNLNDPLLATTPIDGDLLVASHASKDGWLNMSLDGKPGADGQPAESITFERLNDAIRDKTILIPQGVLPAVAGGGVVQTYFHVRGCEIGKSPDFVALLQTALGGRINVTGPKFLSAVASGSSRSFPARKTAGTKKPTPGYYFEYMSYEFSQFYTTQEDLPSRATLIDDFKDGFHVFYDDLTSVPDDQWEEWIPKPLPTSMGPRNHSVTISFDPATGIVPNKLWLNRVFEFNVDQPLMRNSPGGPAADAAADDRRAFMKQILAAEPAFKSDYRANSGLPPVYERHGFDSLDDFMDAYDWVFEAGFWISRRFYYSCKIPITTIGGDQLICNVYPTAGGTPYVGMPASNAALFLTKMAS